MTTYTEITIISISILLLIEGFFSGSELALLSADRISLKKKSKQGNLGAQMALKLLKSPDRILATTLLMTSVSVMGISVLLTLEFRRLMAEHGELYAVMVGSALVIIFGELIPKFIYRKYALSLVPKIAYPIHYAQKTLAPFIHLMTLYTSQITKVIRPLENVWGGKKTSAKDELQGLLRTDNDDTQIKTNEKRIIKKILKFRDKIAKDGLVPLIRVDAIEKHSTLSEAFELYFSKKHSRLPVFDERVDNIIGILELSQIIKQADSKQKIDRFIKPALYVPESQKLEEILNLMLTDDVQIAVVVDEYGGAVGILTREDIFEQIVGDLEDEDDFEKKLIRNISSNEWLAKGRTPLTQINEELGLDLPEGDYDTLAGFLLRQFSRIPDAGDELFFDTKAGQIHFIIRDASRRRIESVSIERFSHES